MERDPKRYARAKLALSLADAGVSLAGAVVLLATPLSRLAAARAEAWVGTGPLAWLVYAALVGGGFVLAGLPLSFYGGFVLEHRYGLSTQSLGGWLADLGKGLAVAAVLGATLLLGFRWVLLHAGAYWGLAAAAGVFVVTVVLVRIAPVVLLPIFYKFKPVADPALTAEIRGVCEQAGLALEGVYQFDMSRSTKKANAAFTGLGKTKRVILGDTLLEAFPREEIRAVVAHEVGHFRHGHLVKGLLFNGVVLALLFLSAQAVYAALAPALGYGPAGDLAGLPLVAAVLGVAGFVAQPASNALSRAFERQADRYAFAQTSPAAMASALRRLAEQNLADTAPNAFVEFWFHSHPSIAKRLRAAEAAGR